MSYLPSILMPPVFILPLFFSPLSASKKSYYLPSYTRDHVALLQNKINPSIQRFIVLVHPYAHTKSKFGNFRWHVIGQTMIRIFYLFYVPRLFCEIEVNFVSPLAWKTTGFVLPFCPWEDCCFSCKWSSLGLKKIKMVRRGGRLFIRIYYCSKPL